MQDGLKRLDNALDSEVILRLLDLSTLSIEPGGPATGALQLCPRTALIYRYAQFKETCMVTCLALICPSRS